MNTDIKQNKKWREFYKCSTTRGISGNKKLLTTKTNRSLQSNYIPVAIAHGWTSNSDKSVVNHPQRLHWLLEVQVVLSTISSMLNRKYWTARYWDWESSGNSQMERSIFGGPVQPRKVVHLERWTSFFETFPVGPNRSIQFWTEISGNFGWMDRAQRSSI